MFSLLAASSIETLVQNNLALFAMGHLGLVLILLVFFFNAGSSKAPKEPKERDEDAFDYATEDGSLFKSNTEGSIPLDALKSPESTDANSDALDEPIVFNSQIREQEMPPEVPHDSNEGDTLTLDESDTEHESADATSDSDDSTSDSDSEPETEEDNTRRKLDRIATILESAPAGPLMLINREERILDLNAEASELFQYQKQDIEDRKIDEIIFLEEQGSSDSDADGLQKAKGHRKDGSHFPVEVELEMADREFGIIMVRLQPFLNEVIGAPQPATESEPAPTDEAATDSSNEKLKLAREEESPEPPAAAPVRSKPLPPPPRPKNRGNSLALQSGGAVTPAGKPLDSKTIEMFSSQLGQPLQSIMQLAQLIASDEKAIPHLKKYAVAIQAKSNRILSQIEEMSMLVSAQTSEISVQEQPFNLGNLMSNIVNLASSVSGEEGSKVRFDRGENDLIVISDEEYFEKALSNLINITLNSAENQEIELVVQSEVTQTSGDPAKTVTFNGQQLKIESQRRLTISTRFPGDEHSHRFFDASINRPESPLVQKLQSSSSLKNHMASIRLMKELARNLGGKLRFVETDAQVGEMQLIVELPCVEVAAYPA